MRKQRVSRLSRSRALCGAMASIQNDPALPALIQSLSPPALAQLCSRVGLSDATQIMAAATPEQLVSALEVMVWKSPRPGVADVFDRSELMEWLAAWLDVGEEFTASALTQVPDEDLVLYFSHVLRVATHEMWGFQRSSEIGDLEHIYAPSYHESAYGPYVATALMDEHWEAVRAALDALWRHDPERVLHLLAQLSADESMLAPQKNRESSNEDSAAARECARERRGHVTAAGARAFLAFGDASSLDDLVALRELDSETHRHLSVIDRLPQVSSTEIAEEQRPAQRLTHREQAGTAGQPHQGPAALTDAAVEAVRAQLAAQGLLDAPSEQLLLTHSWSGKSPPLVDALGQWAVDPEAVDARARELAYLANVLLAGVALNGAAMSGTDAQEAALALCNLGFELLQARREDARLGDSEPGLVRLFLIGRAVLKDTPERVVEAFAVALERLKAEGPTPAHEWRVAEAQAAFEDLSGAVSRHDLAAARDALTLMSFFFDGHSCQSATGLLDEIPRLTTTAGATTALTWIETLEDLSALSRLLERIQIKGHSEA